jgi:hypothetical protein
MTTDIQLPDAVIGALSIPWVDPSQFQKVVAVFGPLTDDGQLELANRLICGRLEYELRRRFEQGGDQPAELREHLKKIGAAATRLLALLHRDGKAPSIESVGQLWCLHQVIGRTLPTLHQVAEYRAPGRVFIEPQHRLRTLTETLVDLIAVAERRDAIIVPEFAESRGGTRREGVTAKSGLIEALITAYAALRGSFPESGPEPGPNLALRQFVRAGLEFAVTYGPIFDSDGRQYTAPEAEFVDVNLAKCTRTTDAAINAIFKRWKNQSQISI